LNSSVINQIIAVKDEEATEMVRRLAKEEGLLVGISSGAAAFAVLQVARELGKGKTAVVILPDSGERYISTGLFEIATEETKERRKEWKCMKKSILPKEK